MCKVIENLCSSTIIRESMSKMSLLLWRESFCERLLKYCSRCCMNVLKFFFGVVIWKPEEVGDCFWNADFTMTIQFVVRLEDHFSPEVCNGGRGDCFDAYLIYVGVWG